jgi:hypothetical protein
MPNLRHEPQVFLVASPHTRHASRGSDSAIAVDTRCARADGDGERWGAESKLRKGEYVASAGCLLVQSGKHAAGTRTRASRDVVRNLRA